MNDKQRRTAALLTIVILGIVSQVAPTAWRSWIAVCMLFVFIAGVIPKPILKKAISAEEELVAILGRASGEVTVPSPSLPNNPVTPGQLGNLNSFNSSKLPKVNLDLLNKTSKLQNYIESLKTLAMAEAQGAAAAAQQQSYSGSDEYNFVYNKVLWKVKDFNSQHGSLIADSELLVIATTATGEALHKNASLQNG